jgi:hypothetical protein
LKKFLPIFSYVFHPIFVPLFTVVLFFYIDINYLATAEKLVLLLQIMIMMVLIPIMFFFLLRTLGKVDSVMASNVGHRKLPLILQAVLIILLMVQSISYNRIPELFFFFLGILLTTVGALFLAFAKLKISLHMAGMAGMLVFILGLSVHTHTNLVTLIAGLFLITGAVASSRLHFVAHDYRELIFGFVAGAIPQLAFWQFWL